jgi:hypothetical protein
MSWAGAAGKISLDYLPVSSEGSPRGQEGPAGGAKPALRLRKARTRDKTLAFRY